MNKELENKIYDAAISAGFVTRFHKYYVSFESSSTLGEDIYFEVSYEDDGTFEDIFDGVLVTFTDFDVDEHAVMLWETYRKSEAPKDLRTLLNDAQAIKNMYGYLYIQMYSLKEKLEKELEEE